MMSRTKIGWVIHGPIRGERTKETQINVCCHENDSELHDVVNEFMNLDNTGVALPRIDRNKSGEERLAIKMAKEDIKYDNGDYEMKLPFRKNIEMQSSLYNA
jgi:hypothetical protein